METQKAQAHESYLAFSESTTKALSDALSLQLSMIEAMTYSGEASSEALTVESPPAAPPDLRGSADPPAIWAPPVPDETPLALDREQCLEFATGSIARVFGEDFSGVDAHPTRVRLPDEPLMLVDRILSFQGEPLSLSSGGVVTEHDVLPGAWYLDGGRIPTCVVVEAGQADLILSAYLGIDFETRGHAMYRLLDAVVTFHGPLPSPGDIIHYDIRIARFFRQGNTHLFRFNFDATVNGEPVLTMRDGCAGFFTREELDAGQGIVQTEMSRQRAPGTRPADWSDLVPMFVESYDNGQVTALRNGDLAGCFGPLFENLGLQNPVQLPGGRMKLVDRIIELDPAGGRFGLGRIRGEMDIFPDDWFLTCHFVDDHVMPGTLMYECCLHTLRVYLTRMGWVGEADRIVYEPVPGVASQLKCRGEVNETTKKVIYEIVIKELGYNPSPYAIADTLMYVDGRPVIEMNNMALQLTGLTREELEQRWQHRETGEDQPAEPLFDHASIRAFAVGNPSEAFGDRYRVFDAERVIARLPGPPYQFLDRVTRIDWPQWVMKAGGTITAEYDVPEDAWYFDANRQSTMPFAVLLEIALQPCGWFAAYMGSALTSDTDLHFRNLGGNATQRANVAPGSGTLSVDVKCTNVSSSAGMIIQNYEYTVRGRQGVVYTGDTYFGFFSAAALENQVGLGADKMYQPSQAELSVSAPFDYPADPPYPGTRWRMVNRIDVYDPKGGKNGLGFIRGSILVDPEAWFFKAHFYQDPVWPGSLGLEAFLQVLKLIAVERWAVGGEPQLEALALNEAHSWTYRGQVLPVDKEVTVEATVTRIDDDKQRIHAEGHLTVDGRVIYEMSNFTVRLTEDND
jgi:3-hydroxymyristoyl/3-hydroxydecanoyl-(acyl carrier protein) dehydratase